jgi:hypothetical protein
MATYPMSAVDVAWFHMDGPANTAVRARLALAQQRMGELKRSAEGPAMLRLFELFGRGPKLIEDLAREIFGSKASLVFTNVVGPADTIHLAGVPVDKLMFCVPHPGEQIGMGLSVFSYRRTVTLTVIADAGLVPHPEAITQAFVRKSRRWAGRRPATLRHARPRALRTRSSDPRTGPRGCVQDGRDACAVLQRDGSRVAEHESLRSYHPPHSCSLPRTTLRPASGPRVSVTTVC